jgi:hypothetical protein
MNKPCSRCDGSGIKSVPLRGNGKAISLCAYCEGMGEVPADRTFAERFGCLGVLIGTVAMWVVIAVVWRSFT